MDIGSTYTFQWPQCREYIPKLILGILLQLKAYSSIKAYWKTHTLHCDLGLPCLDPALKNLPFRGPLTRKPYMEHPTKKMVGFK